MSSSRLRLDLLPTEIIQRIASVSTCEAVLAIVKVNRRLHRTCYDNSVFKAVLRNGNGLGVSKPWDCDLISNNTSTPILARLALADSRAREWSSRATADDRSWKNVVLDSEAQQPSDRRVSGTDIIYSQAATTSDSMLEWAPQLLALKHPFITEEGCCQRIVDQIRGSNSYLPVDIFKINFCVTLATLHHCTAALAEGSVAAPELHEFLHRTLVSGSSSFSLPAQLMCFLVVNGYMVLREIPLPSPARIPFWDLLGGPLPFPSYGDPSFSHLPVMNSRSFLESGEWVGNYNYSMNLRRARWDPPMKGIRFTVEPDEETCKLRASGTDNVGDFALEGTIATSGELKMKKTYTRAAGAWAWDWNAFMTPFGIIGTWGRGAQSHGYFWLWKREWSQE